MYVCRVFSLSLFFSLSIQLSIYLSIYSSIYIPFFLFLSRAVARRLELGKFAARRKFRGRGQSFSTSLHGDDHRESQANRGLKPAVAAVKLKNVPVFSPPLPPAPRMCRSWPRWKGREKSVRGSTTSLLRRTRRRGDGEREQRQLWPWFHGDYRRTGSSSLASSLEPLALGFELFFFISVSNSVWT